MKAMPVILAGIAIVTVTLLGFGSTDDRQSIEGVDVAPTAEPNEVKRVAAETLSASQTVHMAGSQDFEATDVRVSQKHDVPDFVQEADARVVEEITVNSWEFEGVNPYDNYGVFDSTGGIFVHDSHRVAKIDTSNNTQTTWIAPEGWNLVDDCCHQHYTTLSGQYYFIANGNLSSLNPDTGVFTQWDVEVDDNDPIYSIGDSIYFSPNDGILAENHADYFDITYIHSQNYYLEIFGVGAIGRVDMELISPSNNTRTRDNYASDSGFYGVWHNVFSDYYTLLNSESGTYTVRATNQNKTVEKIIEVTEHPFEFGKRVSPPIVFLQKLTPDDATVTSYHVDGLHSYEFNLSVDSLDGSLYFYSGNYLNDLRGIMKFNPSTLDITHWSDFGIYDPEPNGISHDGSNIYWGHGAGRGISQLVNLNTQNETLTATTIPRGCDIDSIVVDSAGNVFFEDCKYEPSTNTFTQFRGGMPNIRIDASDVMYWGQQGYVATATYTARIVPPEVLSIEIDTLTTITIETDSVLTGTPNTSDFTVSNNTVSSVNLESNYIVVTVGTPILPGDETVTISYSGSSIGDGTAQLVPFTREEIDNEIVPNILDISTTSATQISITADNVLQWEDTYDINERTGAFTVSDNTVEDVVIQGKTILITVGTPITSGATVFVSYFDGPDIENLNGEEIDGFTNMPVTNNVPEVQGG